MDDMQGSGSNVSGVDERLGAGAIDRIQGLFEIFQLAGGELYKEQKYLSNTIFIIGFVFGGAFMAMSSLFRSAIHNDTGVVVLSTVLLFALLYRVLRLQSLRELGNNIHMNIELLKKSTDKELAVFKDTGPSFFKVIAKQIEERDAARGLNFYKVVNANFAKTLFAIIIFAVGTTYVSGSVDTYARAQLVFPLAVAVIIMVAASLYQYSVERRLSELTDAVKYAGIKTD